jgi:predicted nucleic acid-binding protein
MLVSNFIVVYDTNVLFPQSLRDLLIRLALKDLFRAKWSQDILDELKRNLLARAGEIAEKTGAPPTLTAEKVDRTIRLMNSAVKDCLVTGYQDIEKSLKLPDPGDNHVLAAAIRAKAEVIVTWNLSDFPPAILSSYDIEAQTPDEFISHLLDFNNGEPVIEAVHEQRASLKNPPYTPQQMLESYTRNQLHGLVKSLSGRTHLI